MNNLKAIETKPNEDCVAVLRDALAKAEAGEMTQVAIAAVLTANEVTHWAAYGGNTQPMTLVGSIERMRLDIMLKKAAL